MICPICSTDNAQQRKTIEGYRKKTFYQIFACRNCLVSFASPTKSDQKIYEAIYQNVENVPGYDRYEKLANTVKNSNNPLQTLSNSEENYHGVIKFLLEDIKDIGQAHIVEIGSGLGYLTYALAKYGFKVSGIDISSEAVQKATSRFGEHYYCGSLSDYIEEKKVNPTHIICTELFEHLEDPIQFTNEMLGSMGKNGQLIFTTPHKRTHSKSIWPTDLPPVHLWWFSKKSIEAIAQRLKCSLNFVDLTEFYKRNPVIEKYPHLTERINGPFFDENYVLINNQSKRSRSIKELLKFFFDKLRNLPLSVERKYQKLTSKPAHMDNQSSASICCVLKK